VLALVSNWFQTRCVFIFVRFSLPARIFQLIELTRARLSETPKTLCSGLSIRGSQFIITDVRVKFRICELLADGDFGIFLDSFQIHNLLDACFNINLTFNETFLIALSKVSCLGCPSIIYLYV
jgi:hypothetical protein